ncbi:MAG: hypothetical protein V4450_00100 [Bacteroidota bacterium]
MPKNQRGNHLSVHPANPPSLIKRQVHILFIFVLFLPTVFLQPVSGQTRTTKIQASARSTISFRELAQRQKNLAPDTARKKLMNEDEDKLPHNLPIPPGAKIKLFKAPPTDTIRRNSSPVPPKNGAMENPQFPGLGDNNTTIPPDIGGAAGPNHLMVTLNSQVRIQDKSGTDLSTVTLNNFFSSLAGITTVFDPKVLYDPFNQRWILTAPANPGATTSALCLGISATSDPTGTWSLYAFDVDAGNINWFDYPSIGFNKNWIVITGNMFKVSNSAFSGAGIFIFDKSATYSGTASPSASLVTNLGGTIVPAITLDNTVNDLNLVSNWNGSSGGNGLLRLFTITGTASAPVFAATNNFPASSQTWASGAASNFAPQSGSTSLIANGDGRIQNAVFRGGSLWCTHTVFIPANSPTRSVIQWWQIDPATGTVQQFGRVTDPGGNEFYAYPSIAVNAYNDVLIGYSSFSSGKFASGNYSFRLHTDAVNTMQSTVQFKAGLASYVKTFGAGVNRWGDYTSTCIDPDDFSLWTIQEYAELPVSGSDRWGTEWNKLIPPLPDLFIQDRPDDLGAEPNPTVLPMWQSEDIWLRKTPDPTHTFAHVTENGEYRTGTANPNYVYVEIRNRGGATNSGSGTEQVILYWAKAGSGLSWPSPWTGGVYFDPGPNTMLMGGIIGTQNLPVIPAGGNTILAFPWSPPDPGVYTGPLAADKNHFCLLARIITPTGMTFTETTALYANVQNNNNIAWKNIAVEDLLPGSQRPAYATIANLGKRKMNIKLRFNGVDDEGNPVLLEKGFLNLSFEGKLKRILETQKISGTGFKQIDKGNFQVQREGGTLTGFILNPNDIGFIQIKYQPKDGNAKPKGFAITVTQIERINGIDKIIGGQTTVFGQVKGFGTSPGKPK